MTRIENSSLKIQKKASYTTCI
uniref:Uncharacterized protein n=1 Tax=Arundo donax TaxID=35708 RepID=A0A0A9EIR5_ARUDO